ncbi:DUF6483 family protein [Desulfosporosinus hippei]|uniref:Tetratricopeptide repeat-containing protein n=1 Tax=Desulfosporosinus hippei DSM 8344 TaxID=1121419 RepID=A0A1G7Y3P1_9FIRM|nr:DUF6483 family protein [Desulfosporosinus hippei]SDG90957.1 hypothetical protein SAMN05443529_107183 [Desulfosporosinus hippei DSM 8344]
MYKNDYIMKMIEQLSIAVAAVLGSKSKTKIEECHQIVNEALYDLTGMSEETLLKLSHKDLISIISGGKETNMEKCFALAEMLKLKADVDKEDTGRSVNLYLKSLNILIELILAKSSHGHNSYKTINEIVGVLKKYKIPKESNQLLFRYYEFTGRYDKAEDVLFKMIVTINTGEIVDEGFAFYERLKGKTLVELENGNLPIDEVIEGLDVYRNLLNNPT